MATSDLPKAEYRQLGQSGLRVSNPILGAMSIGDSRWMPWVLNEDGESFTQTLRTHQLSEMQKLCLF